MRTRRHHYFEVLRTGDGLLKSPIALMVLRSPVPFFLQCLSFVCNTFGQCRRLDHQVGWRTVELMLNPNRNQGTSASTSTLSDANFFLRLAMTTSSSYITWIDTVAIMSYNSDRDDTDRHGGHRENADEDGTDRNNDTKDNTNENETTKDDSNEDGDNKPNTNADGTECKLLQLPRELRDQIYRCILVSELPLEKIIYIFAESCRNIEEGRGDRGSRSSVMAQMCVYDKLIDTRILRANHQVYTESLEVFHKENTFIFNILQVGMINHLHTQCHAAKIQASDWCGCALRFAEDTQWFISRLRDGIATLGFHDKGLKSLQIEITVPSNAWLKDYYGRGQEMRQFLDALKDVRIDARVEFRIGFRHFDWSLSYDRETKGQKLFVEGMERLGQVMNGALRVADFEWPGP